MKPSFRRSFRPSFRRLFRRSFPPSIPTSSRTHFARWAATTTGLALAALCAVVGAAAAAAATKAPAKPAALSAQAQRGKYIVSTAGCHDCHTPWHMGPSGPEPDMSRALSGHPEQLQMPPAPSLPEGPWLVVTGATNTAFAGPWGVSFTANLTPDADTGLGRWTLRDFVQTIRTGKRTGRGRDILPPMPIPVYNNLTDADLEAVYAYLRTIPPVKNRVPEPRPPAAR
ncbi:MAG: c-type cytochrome [Betaproteobacteria bacterium]|jgi:mono/diheme cytochrome c family protein|nr:c-type cytochrome [Betaproteobacteria bacterium]MCC6250254.1 c-type cytochrome [Rubrivivax sp.]MCL4697141.1 c-type cytochrome [Burkholderiaceae bacterium]